MELNKFIRVLICFLLFMIFAVIYIFYMNYLTYNWKESAEAWGQFGDFVGGTLNPLLTFCSFLALLVTIVIQNKQLGVSSKELSTASEILKKNQTVMSEQLITQSLQQFDSIFFAMLKDLNVILLELENKEVGKKSSLTNCYEHVFNNEQYNEYSLKDANEIILFHRMTSRYFMLLYQILKITNNRLTENSYINDTNRTHLIKMYSNIVRASVSEEAMQLLMINALHNSFKPFKILLEKFNFFEHTSFYQGDNYSFLLINAAQSYNISAFDQSFYWANLIQSNLFGKYIPHHNLISRKDFFYKIFSMLSSDKCLIGPFGNQIYSNKNYFCKIGENKQGYPVGFLLDEHSYQPTQFGNYFNEVFHSYIIVRVVENTNQLILYTRDLDDKLIEITFLDNCDVSFEIAQLLRNF